MSREMIEFDPREFVFAFIDLNVADDDIDMPKRDELARTIKVAIGLVGSTGDDLGPEPFSEQDMHAIYKLFAVLAVHVIHGYLGDEDGLETNARQIVDETLSRWRMKYGMNSQ